MNTEKSVKIFSLILFGILLVNFLSVFVVADPPLASGDGGDVSSEGTNTVTGEKVGEVAAKTTKEIGKGFLSFLDTLFGKTALGNESLSRFFMSILIAMFVYTALGTFFSGQSKYIHWGATIAVTVLAIIGLPAEFLESIRTGYGAMGATILSVIPFLIIFWFSIKTKSLVLARITWVFYSFYYLGLYLSAIFTIGEKQGIGLSWTNYMTNGSTFPYLIAFFIGVIIFFGIKWFRQKWFANILESWKEEAGQAQERRKFYQEQAQKRDKNVTETMTSD